MRRGWRVAAWTLIGLWALSRAPQAVSRFREEVNAALLSRSAALAGEAVLGVVGRVGLGGGEVPVYVVPVGQAPEPPTAEGDYATQLASWRRARAAAAVAAAPETGIPAVVEVDGDPYLVLPRGRGLDGSAPPVQLVAWWPEVEAAAEARAGVPLQLGGEPPKARLAVGAASLVGPALWALPTRDTETRVSLFPGWSAGVLVLSVLLLLNEWRGARAEAARTRDQQSTRDAILQRLSHELRTPAASVRSLVDAMESPGTTEAERQQFMDLARSEAMRLSTGLDRLLQAARGATVVRVDRVPLDLYEWAEATRARWLARLPGLTVEGRTPCPASADPERLDEAVDALLDNARKYGGPNVVLTVTPERISVEDDGEGIAPRDRARVLNKFERVEGRVNDPGGHGLGLWAAGEVARAHRGRLTIEGANRFVLTLGAP